VLEVGFARIEPFAGLIPQNTVLWCNEIWLQSTNILNNTVYAAWCVVCVRGDLCVRCECMRGILVCWVCLCVHLLLCYVSDLKVQGLAESSWNPCSFF
jgi:hypothetical protein